MIRTKIGDIFSASIGNRQKKYFQLIAFDSTQLNSDVIRIFSKLYHQDVFPSLSDVVNDEVQSYLHCVTSLGIKMGLWELAGHSQNVGCIHQIVFRGTKDYGHKAGEIPKKSTDNWYIWRIGDLRFTKVGKLIGEDRNSHIGLVINPLGVIEILKGNKYPPTYPDIA